MSDLPQVEPEDVDGRKRLRMVIGDYREPQAAQGTADWSQEPASDVLLTLGLLRLVVSLHTERLIAIDARRR